MDVSMSRVSTERARTQIGDFQRDIQINAIGCIVRAPKYVSGMELDRERDVYETNASSSKRPA